MTTLDDLIARGDDAADLTSPAAQPVVRGLADDLLAVVAGDSSGSLARLAEIGRSVEVPIDVRVASRLATSKLRVETISACDIVVQFAMWGEHRRLRPRDSNNPLGEDALRVKLDQLDWLLADSPVRWRLQAIDDGCPDDSAGVAKEMADQHPLGDRVSVLRLADVLPATTGPLAGLDHPDDSHKGGAMLLGAQHAVDAGAHAVILTDADVSVDLGQIGLLLGPWQDGADVVIGDRKHPDSVLRKAEARWGPGIVVLRHMQRMVGRALFSRGIADTQAAFKLYGAPALADVLAAPSTFGFSFDSDWLYAAINGDHTIATTPFAFVDSFAESASITQGPMSTWESLLVGLTASARERGADHHDGMAAVIDSFANEAVLTEVVKQVPAALVDVDPASLGDPELMTPEALREWIASILDVPPMPVTLTMEELATAIDLDIGSSEWIEIDQAMIELFADATRDHQWIHVDHEKAAAGPFGQTIAHGFLTVSLLPELLGQMISVEGSQMGVNYGMDRLRLTSPVPSGARIRANGKILETQPKGDGILIKTEMTVEIEGQSKPAMVGVFLTLRY